MIRVGDYQTTELGKQLVNQVLNSGRLTNGPMISKFEEKFAKYHGFKYGVFVNSGTSALQIAIHALKIKYGWEDGEILCPAVTFVATANTIVQNGFTPIFVDVDPVSLNISPYLLEEKITPKTRAIMVVDLCGNPVELDLIKYIADKYNLKIIDDACEADGAELDTRTDVACFSTYAAHTLVTGVGGLACTNEKELAMLMRSLANHGRDGIYFTNKSEVMKMSKRFLFHHVGYSYRATEMEAALGLAGLKDLKKNIVQRRKNALYLKKGLLGLPIITSFDNPRHTYMMFPIIASNDRDKLTAYLEKKGIETRYLLPLINQPIYKTTGYPVAEFLNEHAFYIGCHPYLTRKELDYVIETFKSFYSRN